MAELVLVRPDILPGPEAQMGLKISVDSGAVIKPTEKQQNKVHFETRGQLWQVGPHLVEVAEVSGWVGCFCSCRVL